MTLGQRLSGVRDGLRPRARLPLILHFHGAPWLIEHHVANERLDVALVTFDLGSGSAVYGKAFADPSTFRMLQEEAGRATARVLGQPVTFEAVVLTSF